jgi:hypothetical protein
LRSTLIASPPTRPALTFLAARARCLRVRSAGCSASSRSPESDGWSGTPWSRPARRSARAAEVGGTDPPTRRPRCSVVTSDFFERAATHDLTLPAGQQRTSLQQLADERVAQAMERLIYRADLRWIGQHARYRSDHFRVPEASLDLIPERWQIADVASGCAGATGPASRQRRESATGPRWSKPPSAPIPAFIGACPAAASTKRCRRYRAIRTCPDGAPWQRMRAAATPTSQASRRRPWRGVGGSGRYRLDEVPQLGNARQLRQDQTQQPAPWVRHRVPQRISHPVADATLDRD